jgi:hypothetical protein
VDRPLSDDEARLLAFLIGADGLDHGVLADQAAAARVTGTCSCGCATFDAVVDRSVAAVIAGLPGHHVVADADWEAEGGGVMLWMTDGWISGVEVWTTGDERATHVPPLAELGNLRRSRFGR